MRPPGGGARRPSWTPSSPEFCAEHLRRGAELQARYLETRQRGYESFAALIEAFAGADVLTRPQSPEELAALIDLCWMISEQRLVNLELRGRAFDEAGIQEGISTMRQLFRPYLVGESRRKNGE